MAISLTAANIRPLTGCVTRNFKAGGALTVGDPAYLDSNGYVQEADANAGETQARARGVVVASKDGETSVTSGDRCTLAVFGPVGGFSGMTPGAPVYISSTAGEYTHTKPTGGAYQQPIGWAEAADVLFVNSAAGDPSSV